MKRSARALGREWGATQSLAYQSLDPSRSDTHPELHGPTRQKGHRRQRQRRQRCHNCLGSQDHQVASSGRTPEFALHGAHAPQRTVSMTNISAAPSKSIGKTSLRPLHRACESFEQRVRGLEAHRIPYVLAVGPPFH